MKKSSAMRGEEKKHGPRANSRLHNVQLCLTSTPWNKETVLRITTFRFGPQNYLGQFRLGQVCFSGHTRSFGNDDVSVLRRLERHVGERNAGQRIVAQPWYGGHFSFKFSEEIFVCRCLSTWRLNFQGLNRFKWSVQKEREKRMTKTQTERKRKILKNWRNDIEEYEKERQR